MVYEEIKKFLKKYNTTHFIIEIEGGWVYYIREDHEVLYHKQVENIEDFMFSFVNYDWNPLIWSWVVIENELYNPEDLLYYKRLNKIKKIMDGLNE